MFITARGFVVAMAVCFSSGGADIDYYLFQVRPTTVFVTMRSLCAPSSASVVRTTQEGVYGPHSGKESKRLSRTSLCGRGALIMGTPLLYRYKIRFEKQVNFF